ncbi:MAG: hypothetical protein II973_11005 [Spirochaetaceae bacterium]|nr:hypothetical protein [Spirochaetaceae bacterium]
MRKESTKYIKSIFLAVLTTMLLVSCGGGGGGGGMVSFSNNSELHNGGDAGGWGGSGGGNNTSNSSVTGSLSSGAGTFTPPNDIDWSSIELTITVTSGGTTTTHTLLNTETEAIAELLTSLKRGDVVEVTADITMVDDDPRTTSSGAVTIGVGDNHISLPTPYKFSCSMEMTRNMYEDYGCSDTPSDASVSGIQTGIYTVNNASSVIPPDASGTGFIFDHWETVPDGQIYVPGSSRGDVVISPVFKPDYSVAYTDLVDTIVITKQSEFNTLMSTHAAQTFSGKEIKLYSNVSTSTGFTNITDGFQGMFDGQNYTANVTLSNDDENGLGFCYKLASGATIQNLTISGSVIYNGYATNNNGDKANVGAFAGLCTGGTITNCKNRANVQSTNIESNDVGGIVGNCRSDSTITKCSNYGNVVAAAITAGGITGTIDSSSSIDQCFNKGNIKAEGETSSSQQSVGGIVGWCSGASITNCYNTGNINITRKINDRAGGILGITPAGTASVLNNCFHFNGSITSSFVPPSNYCHQICGILFDDSSTMSNIYCSDTSDSGVDSVVEAGTIADAKTDLPDGSIWELRPGAPYPTLINNPE